MNINRTDGDFNTEILSPIESGVVVPYGYDTLPVLLADSG